MTTDYNPIAAQYKQSKDQPWRTYVRPWLKKFAQNNFTQES